MVFRMICNLFHLFLSVFLVIGAIFYVPVTSSSVDPVGFGYLVQELFFRYGTMGLFALSMVLKPKRRLNEHSLWLFFSYVLISSLFNGFTNFERHSILNIFFWLMLYKVIFENFDFNQIKFIAWALGLLLFANLAMCAIQFNGIPFLFTNASNAVPGVLDTCMGFMKVKAFLGILCAILFPILIVYAPVFSICIIPLMFFGVSSASMLALLISSSFMALKFFGKTTALVAIGAVLAASVAFVVFYDFPGGQFGERFKTWLGVSELAMKMNPITGSGIGSFKQLNFALMQDNGEPIVWTWVHNEFIQSFYEIGAIGVGLILYYLHRIKFYADWFGKDKMLTVFSACVIAVLVISLFHFPFHLARFSHLLAFLFAIYHARGEDLKNAQ